MEQRKNPEARPPAIPETMEAWVWMMAIPIVLAVLYALAAGVAWILRWLGWIAN